MTGLPYQAGAALRRRGEEQEKGAGIGRRGDCWDLEPGKGREKGLRAVSRPLLKVAATPCSPAPHQAAVPVKNSGSSG